MIGGVKCVQRLGARSINAAQGFRCKVKGWLTLWGLISSCSSLVFLPLLAFISLYAVHFVFIRILTLKRTGLRIGSIKK